MAYFNHAFCKAFVADSVYNQEDAIKTPALAAGQISFFQDSTWESVASGDLGTATKLLYLVQGSFRTSDTIGNNPGHGGYSESIKSKGINPKYITRMWSSVDQTATKSTSTVTVASDCAPCGENLFLRLDVKGSPALRFLNHNAYAIGDSSGDAEANGGPLPGLCCADGQEYLDPALALAAASQMLLADPIIKPFVQEQQWEGLLAGITVTTTAGLDGVDTTSTVAAGGTDYTVGDIVTVNTGTSLAVVRVDTVGGGGAVTAFTVLAAGSGYSAGASATTNVTVADPTATGFQVTVVVTTDGSGTFSIAEILDGTYTASTDPVADGVTASVTFVGAYVDTQFGNCSFDTRDHYEKEPVQIIASLLDETGNPCNDCGTVVTTPGTMAQTSGETVLRHILLTENYMQNPYNQGNTDSARIREIEGIDEVVGGIDRTVLYKAFYIQHSVPRFNNPTGVFDNDQYVYVIYVKASDGPTITAVRTYLTALAGVAGITFDQDIDAYA